MVDKDVKRVLLIGNRCGVLREISQFPQLQLTHVFSLAGSLLDSAAAECSCNIIRFTEDERHQVCDQLTDAPFDLLISNGCPFIIPISKLRRPHQLFINVHPSPLPRMKGRHPVNGALLHGEQIVGATMHFMDDKVDAGRVIHQETIPLTPDLDLGLLYRLLFDHEATVFRAGMQKLIDSNFQYAGETPSGVNSYYTRRSEDQQVDFRTFSDEQIVNRVKAFGIASQGVTADLNGRRLRLFDAEPIRNPHVLAKFATCEASTILMEYEGRYLVKSRDGVIKINRGEELSKLPLPVGEGTATSAVEEICMKRTKNDLAILGGSQAFPEPLHVGRPNIGNRERLLGLFNDMLDRRWLTNQGPLVQEFERRIAEHCGVKHCVAMCNGTVALEIVIRALGLTGEVIMPSFTFIATAHALQ